MIEFQLNGQKVKVEPEKGMTRLLDVIRKTPKKDKENEFFTGTKEGCGEGECGACSVLVNGVLVNSCLIPVLQMDGQDVKSVEGIVPDLFEDTLRDSVERIEAQGIVNSFLKKGGAQCGICTPGMVVATAALLDKKKKLKETTLSRDEIRQALAGNLCRCTGYQKIIDSVKECFDEYLVNAHRVVEKRVD